MALNLTTAKSFRQYAAVEGKNRPPVHQIFVHAQPNGDALSPLGLLVDGAIVPPTFTAATSDLLTTVGHGLVAGVRLRVTTTGTLPAGLSLATDYYVIASGLTADDFKVSASYGGSAVDITDAGTGTHSWARYLTEAEQDAVTRWRAHPVQTDLTSWVQASLWAAAYTAYQNSPRHKAWLVDDYLQRDSQWTWRWADHMDASATATPPSASDTGTIVTPPPTSPANASPN